MIKDRNIKLNLIKYYIQKYCYPQLEVNILSKQRISKTRKLVTDVDVIGLYPDVSGSFKMILGDCKTFKGASPITRSLWMKGLMEYLKADKAIIILSKEIEKEHQLTSSDLGIQLLSEKDFEIYSRHTIDQLIDIRSALTEGETWDVFFSAFNKFPALSELQTFSDTAFWNEESNSNRLRHALAHLRQHKGELNPANNLHLAIVLNHYSLAAIALNDIVNKIFNRYLLPSSFDELDNDLKVIIWGGIENYEYLNEMRKRFLQSHPAEAERDLTLPQWDKFLEFIRSGLENPLGFNYLPLFLKEVAFELISENKGHNYSKIVSAKNKYIISFAVKLSNYLTKSAGLPSEFHDIFEKKIYSIMN